MGALSPFIKTQVYDVLTGRLASYTTGGAVWAQLHTGAPGSAGTANRAPNLARWLTTWGTPASRAVSSTNIVSFPNLSFRPTADFYVTLWDAASGGNYLGGDIVTPTDVLAIGDTWQIPAGQLQLSLGSGGLSDACVHRILNMVIGSATLTGTGVAPYLQLHNGDPGTNGTNNVMSDAVNLNTGASGRIQTPAWTNAPASDGSGITNPSVATIGFEFRSVQSARGPVTWWDAASGGNYLGVRGTTVSSTRYPGDWYTPTVPLSISMPGTI